MRNAARVVLGASAVLVAAVLSAPPALALDKIPTEKQCNDKANPLPADPVVQGACVVVIRTKGNCMACHDIKGLNSGNIAPPLVAMQQRFPGDEGKKKLRAQIEDATKTNPRSMMPPFGRHDILNKQEIDNVVEFMLTL
jgi:sulfur-oxidizing protein SoxX